MYRTNPSINASKVFISFRFSADRKIPIVKPLFFAGRSSNRNRTDTVIYLYAEKFSRFCRSREKVPTDSKRRSNEKNIGRKRAIFRGFSIFFRDLMKGVISFGVVLSALRQRKHVLVMVQFHSFDTIF